MSRRRADLVAVAGILAGAIVGGVATLGILSARQHDATSMSCEVEAPLHKTIVFTGHSGPSVAWRPASAANRVRVIDDVVHLEGDVIHLEGSVSATPSMKCLRYVTARSEYSRDLEAARRDAQRAVERAAERIERSRERIEVHRGDLERAKGSFVVRLNRAGPQVVVRSGDEQSWVIAELEARERALEREVTELKAQEDDFQAELEAVFAELDAALEEELHKKKKRKKRR